MILDIYKANFKEINVKNTMLDKVSDKIKKIVGIEKFDDTNILINTDCKLSDIISKNLVILIVIINLSDDSEF